MAVDVLPLLKQEAAERRAAGNAEGGRRSGQTRAGEKTKSRQEVDATSTTEVPTGRAAEQAAHMLGTNRQSVTDAARLKEQAPDLFQKVRDGKVSVGKAKRESCEREKRRAMVDRGHAADAPPVEKQLTAYHEAGHAAAAYVLGGTVGAVSIKPEPGRLGYADARANRDTEFGERLRDRLIIYLAGEESEVKWGGLPASAKQTARSDLQSVHDAKNDAGRLATPCQVGDGIGSDTGGSVVWRDETRRAYVAWLRSLTRDLLAAGCVWRAVCALAEELLRRETLTGEEATAVIAAKTGRMERWHW